LDEVEHCRQSLSDRINAAPRRDKQPPPPPLLLLLLVVVVAQPLTASATLNYVSKLIPTSTAMYQRYSSALILILTQSSQCWVQTVG